MEQVIIGNKDIKDFFSSWTIESEKNKFIEDGKKIELSKVKESIKINFDEFSPEDSSSFFKNTFLDRDFHTNENWEVNESIEGKIINFNDSEVFVDCLIDTENTIIQSRSFPINLFSNLIQLKKGKPILIKCKSKPGSYRIDIFPGEGIVKTNVFDLHDKWESLRGQNLDTKLKEW